MVEDMPEISVNAQTCESCESCELGKQQWQPFPQNMSKRATHKVELIHSDICGHSLIEQQCVFCIIYWWSQ